MQETILSDKNRRKAFILTFVMMLMSVIGLSYAYFAMSIVGNDTASSMKISTADKTLIYTDIEIMMDKNVKPGWTDTKTLTVENIGNKETDYSIIWRDLLNEITNDELVISATCVSTSGTCYDLKETVIPTATTETHDVMVKSYASIAPGVTHTYTVTVEFKETGLNQYYNKGKRFRGTLNIGEGTKPIKYTGIDSTTGFRVVQINTGSSTEEFYILNDVIDYPTLVSTNGNLYNYESGKMVLLAKYLLDKTSIIQTTTTDYSYTDVKFDETNYWYDTANSALYSQYGTLTNYANNIYDSNYSDASGTNYSVAYYAEMYFNKLGVDGTVRALTYTEANELTQTQRANGQWQWLGSACSNSTVYLMNTSGSYTCINSTSVYAGVRPVIVVNASYIDFYEEPPKLVRAGTDSTTGLPVVKYGTEEFYDITNAIDYSSLIATTGNMYNYASGKTVLLAKYNLYVGRIYNDSNSTYTEIQSSASGYGLQSSSAKGYVDGDSQYIGVVPFSGSSNNYGYWDPSGSGINSTYGTYTNSANNIYDTTYTTAPNWSVAFRNNAGNANYSIAYYVEEYVNKLGINGTGRLLTYTEEQSLASSNSSIVFNGTTYWLGSASNDGRVWLVSSDGTLDNGTFGNSYNNGVRPVIVVDTSEIEAAPAVRAGTDSDTGLPKVMIGSEEFLDLTNAINYSTLVSTNGNLYNYASDKSILLAKYNLYVGAIYNTSSNTYTVISSSASGYGLQNSNAKGSGNSGNEKIGVVPFTSATQKVNNAGQPYYDTYWFSDYSTNSTIYSKYGAFSDHANNIYDASRNQALDWNYINSISYGPEFLDSTHNTNYSIAYYVEDYLSRLGINATGRLLTYTEANALTKAQRTNGAYYWLASTQSVNCVDGVLTNGNLDIDIPVYAFAINYGAGYGVRPVIVMNTSDIAG